MRSNKTSKLNKIFLVFVTVFVLISIVWLYKYKLNNLLPIKTVQVFAPMRYLTEKEVKSQLQPLFEQTGFFNINMDNLDKKLRDNNWAKNINIARIWPDTVRVTFDEKNPLAYWSDRGIITDQNCEIIDHKLDSRYINKLPKIVGEKKNSKKLCDILEKLLIYTKYIDIDIKNIFISKRGAWYLELENGIYVLLGKDNILERAKNFVSFYSKKGFVNAKDRAMGLDNIQYFDLRYQNGIAVGNRFTDTINVIRETA